MKARLVALALLMLTACGDPLPPEVQWLAGRWRWTGSCCDLGGLIHVPVTTDAFVIDLHHNGEAEISDARGDEMQHRRTRFEVDIVRGDTLIRFDDPLIFDGSRFKIMRRLVDYMGFVDHPLECADCLSTHGFVRVP